MKREERLNDIETSLRLALDDRQAKIWTSIPAQVVDVDLEKQTITAQPSIQAIYTDENGDSRNVTLPLLADVPIVWPRAGGFSLTFPIKSGDEVLIVFASRCIDAWYQSSSIQPQLEQRMHDLSDGFAILAPTSQPKKINNISANSVQLRNDTGDTFIEIDSSGDANIICQSALVSANSEIDITAPQINLNGNVNVVGNLETTGQITTNGITSNGKSFDSHTHGGVDSGTNQTLPPT